MEEENKNPVENTGQTPESEGATEMPDISQEQIAGLTKEQIVDLYVNAKEALKKATQRNQEAAEFKRQYEEQVKSLNDAKKYYEEKYMELIDRQNDLLANLGQLADEEEKSEGTEEPENLSPAVQEKIKKMEEELAKVKEEMLLIPAKLEFDKKITQLMGKFPYLTPDKLTTYFNARPKLPVTDENLEIAAREINEAEKKRLDALLEKRIKEKEELEKKATSQVKGVPATGGINPESFYDLPPAKQEEVALELLRKFKKG